MPQKAPLFPSFHGPASIASAPQRTQSQPAVEQQEESSARGRQKRNTTIPRFGFPQKDSRACQRGSDRANSECRQRIQASVPGRVTQPHAQRAPWTKISRRPCLLRGPELQWPASAADAKNDKRSTEPEKRTAQRKRNCGKRSASCGAPIAHT